MAQKRHLTQYDSSGNKREIYLNDDEVLLEGGQTLRNRLAEMQEDIEEAAEQGGIQQETDPTVPSWAKQPVKPTYTPQEVGAVPSQGYVEYTQAEKEKLGALPTASELSTQLGEKANTDDVYDKQTVDQKVANAGKVKSVSVNDEQPVQPDQNGNVHLEIEGDEGKSAYQSYLDTTTDNPKKTEPEWVASLKGPKGDTGNVVVSDGVAQIGIINDLETGGEGDALSAEMGKQLAQDVDDIPVIAISVVGRKIVINTNAALAPRVIVGDLSKSALSCRGGQTDTATFNVSGRRLTGNIGIEVTGDTTHFSVSPGSLTPSSGEVANTQITVTYTPGAGATAGTTHNCTVTISSGGVTYGTLELAGTVAAAPSITLTPASLTISAESGQQGTGTINVKGTALDADVTLTLSGSSYMSFEAGSSVTTKTIAKADAMASGGADVTIYYTGTASDSGTITAASTGATSATANVSGSVAVRLAEGDTITKDGMTFTVLADTTKVSVKATSSSSVSGNLVIPSSVHDSNGFSYAVTECAMYAFKNCTSLTGVTIPDSITSYGSGYTFQSCQNLASVTLGSGATTLGSNMFYDCRELTSIVIPDSVISLGGELFKGCKKLATIQIGTSTDCACTTADNALKNACGQGVSSDGSDSALRTIICYATTPPTFNLYDTAYGYGLPISFFGESGNGTLKVPSSAVSTYQNSSASGKTLWAKIPTIEAITE